jgi:hypothetical protein
MESKLELFSLLLLLISIKTMYNILKYNFNKVLKENKMALVIPKIQKDMEAAIVAALKTEFAKEGSADTTSHKRLAAAIAKGVTQVIIKALTTDAQVMPGIATAGSQSAQTTISSGKIV